MTSATEILRRLLDERGVEYEAPHAGFTIVRTDNAVCKFYETLEEPEHGVFAVVTTDWLTPAQAIAATLGRGTCRALDGESSSGAPLQAGDYDEFWEPAGVCSECGELIPLRNYCPNCGRKVVEP